MSNKKNLIPQAHKLTVEEQSKGGKASGEKRRERRKLAECLEDILAQNVPKKNISGVQQLAISTFLKACKGDIKAIEFICEIVNEKPTPKVEIISRENDALDEIIKQLEQKNA